VTTYRSARATAADAALAAARKRAQAGDATGGMTPEAYAKLVAALSDAPTAAARSVR